MDRALSESTKRKQKRKIIIRITGIFLFVVISILLLRNFIRPTISTDEFYTGHTTIGNIQATVSTSGTVVPEFEEIISSPIPSRITKIIHNAGDEIDSVIELYLPLTLVPQLNKPKNNPIYMSKLILINHAIISNKNIAFSFNTNYIYV